MDNKAYLDQIAVKGKKSSSFGPILSPLVIKLLIVAAIAVIAMFIVGSMISAQKTERAKVDQRVYVRISSLIQSTSPIIKNQNNLRSSDLRAYTSTLTTSLTTTLSKIDSVASVIKLDTANINPDVASDNATVISTYDAELSHARLNGRIDNSYAISTAYQISLLMSLERQARNKTTNDTYAAALDASLADLEIIYNNFKQYADTR